MNRKHTCRFNSLIQLVLAAVCVLGASAASSRRDECKNARNPIIILPGIMGSDLDVRLLNSFGPCAVGASHFTLWPPFNPDLLTNLNCFKYLLQPVPCQKDGQHNSFCSNPGVTMWVDPGGDDGTKTFAFKQGGYNRLVDFLERHFDYKLGRDLFAAPYDWRLNLQALEEAGQYDAIMKRVSDAVSRNCGKKALIIGHSMGTLVSLGILQNPRYKAWRQQNVMAYIALAPPLGGSTSAIASKLGGNRNNLLPAMGDFLQPVLNEIIYHGSRGLPSMLMLMPYRALWGKDYVLVSTPERNYTLGDLKTLFSAIGDTQSADLFEDAHNLNMLLDNGPVPDIETYCIYGSEIPTVKAWNYRSIVRDRPATLGSAMPALLGQGDGVVNVESMRLCNRLTNTSHIYELGYGVNHGNVMYHPASLEVLREVLNEVLPKR